jgi:uncharacterized protein YlxP (DUF503 family)
MTIQLGELLAVRPQWEVRMTDEKFNKTVIHVDARDIDQATEIAKAYSSTARITSVSMLSAMPITVTLCSHCADT